MKILSNQQINYCNLIKQTDTGSKNLPGVEHSRKLHTKDCFFPLAEKEQALEYCRNKFLETKGKASYLLTEDQTGFTVWKEDKQVKLANNSSKSDIVDSINLEKLVSKMRNIGGIKIKDRYHNLKKYPKSFIGSEVVTWFKSELDLSTSQAVRLGQRLVDAKIIHHVVDRHDFKNEFLFYCFYWDED